MLSMVEMVLKREVRGCALNSHRNYIVDHGKSWKNHGIVFLNFYGNPVSIIFLFSSDFKWLQKSKDSLKPCFKNINIKKCIPSLVNNILFIFVGKRSGHFSSCYW